MPIADFEIAVPATMHAAVYKGGGVVAVEQVPTPEIGAGELLVRVEVCGVCHTGRLHFDGGSPAGAQTRFFGRRLRNVIDRRHDARSMRPAARRHRRRVLASGTPDTPGDKHIAGLHAQLQGATKPNAAH